MINWYGMDAASGEPHYDVSRAGRWYSRHDNHEIRECVKPENGFVTAKQRNAGIRRHDSKPGDRYGRAPILKGGVEPGLCD